MQQQAPTLQRTGQPNVRFRERKPNRVLETIGTPEGQARVHDFLQRQEAHTPAAFVRAVLFLAGAQVPEGETPLELAQSLAQLRWTPIPACFTDPAPGDVFFVCDDAGQPVDCGFVAQVQPPREGVEPFFMAFERTGKQRRRLGAAGERPDFLMRGAGT